MLLVGRIHMRGKRGRVASHHSKEASNASVEVYLQRFASEG